MSSRCYCGRAVGRPRLPTSVSSRATGALRALQMSRMGYINYSNPDGSGVNNFDGQGSGSDFYGTVRVSLRLRANRSFFPSFVVVLQARMNVPQMWDPPIGWVNNTDGGRSILFPVRQCRAASLSPFSRAKHGFVAGLQAELIA